MKKLFLLAILLGLSGCGNNNQNDTSQSDTQTTQLQTTELAVPIASNYKLVASSLMMSPTVSPLGGWSITNSEVMGASTLIDAVKDSRVSAALVTPNAKQVAEVLRGGVAGVALAIAVDQLLDAVDWVLDPANNSIKYKEQLPNYPTVPWMWATGAGQQSDYIYPTAEAAARAICSYYGESYKEIYWYSHPVNAPVAYVWCVTSDGYRDNWDIRGRANPAYNPNIKLEEKYLSLEAVAEQVISNADAGSSDAQVATNTAAQNILNDEELAKPVVDELERNAQRKCLKHEIWMDDQAARVRDRYTDMYRDRYNQYENHYDESNPLILDGVNKGSWMGHVTQYRIQQGKLQVFITRASNDNCPATPFALYWVKKNPPPKPGVDSVD